MDDDIIDENLVSKKHRKLISQLRDIEDSEASAFDKNTSDSSDDPNYQIPSPSVSESSFLPSTMLKKKKKKKKDSDEYDPDKWFADMMEVNDVGKINKSGKNDYYSVLDNGDFIFGKKKKKKHKKEDGDDKVDFKKEFEPEMALYRNLLIEQNKFTDNLQKQYDNITGFKSSSRGVTKQLSDLIENITDARALSMQLVEKNVNAKKLIAELSLKQKKELGGLDSDNLSDAASNYIKQMMNERQSLLNNANGDNSVSEYSDDEMINMIDDSLSDSDRSDETEKYLKYENSNVTTYVVIENDDVENYHYIAKDENGNILDDYPLPLHTDISVNRSTNIATDSYGEKYPIIFK